MLLVIQYMLRPAGTAGTKITPIRAKAPIITYCWLPTAVGDCCIETRLETAIDPANNTISTTVSAPCGFSIIDWMKSQLRSPDSSTWCLKLSPRRTRYRAKKMGI